MVFRNKYNVLEKQENRRFRLASSIIALLALAFFGGLFFIVYDLNQNPEVIDDSKNSAVLGEFVTTDTKYKTVITGDYTMRIPEKWVKVNSPQIIQDGISYYPDRYQGVSRDDVGRWIDVYKRALPDLEVDKVLKIEADGNSIIVGDLSSQCINFTELETPGVHIPTTGSFQGLSFTCSMTQAANTLLAAETNPSDGVHLIGDKTRNEYMFVFGDHSSHIDNTVFQHILRSFQVK